MQIPDIRNDARLADVVARAVAEDVGRGDVTTLALVPDGCTGRAVVLSRGDYIVAGTAVAGEVFRQVDQRLSVTVLIPDGQAAGPDAPVLRIEGPACGILTGERTALNFIQRMTGIATLTHRFVEAVAPYGTAILDTRKTTPGLRFLEKYAVRCGGGVNHRFGLFDMVLVKDNHRHIWRETGRGDLGAAVAEARRLYRGVPVEIEVESEDDLLSALRERPEWIMLDNMAPDAMKRCVELCAGRCRLEASGGIRLENVAAAAASGVDAISLGCLTHSAPAADLSLEMEGAA